LTALGQIDELLNRVVSPPTCTGCRPGSHHQSGNATLQDGTTAHRARLKRGIERTAREIGALQSRTGFTQGYCFRVCSRVTGGADEVSATRHHCLTLDNDRAYSNVALGFPLRRFLQCNAHKILMISWHGHAFLLRHQPPGSWKIPTDLGFKVYAWCWERCQRL